MDRTRRGGAAAVASNTNVHLISFPITFVALLASKERTLLVFLHIICLKLISSFPWHHSLCITLPVLCPNSRCQSELDPGSLLPSLMLLFVPRPMVPRLPFSNGCLCSLTSASASLSYLSYHLMTHCCIFGKYRICISLHIFIRYTQITPTGHFTCCFSLYLFSLTLFVRAFSDYFYYFLLL